VWEKEKTRGGSSGSFVVIVAGGNRPKKNNTSALRLQVFACALFSASGNGNGSSWNNRGANGNYWSASFNSARNARNLNFNSGGVNPQNNNNRYNGFAVRAVQHLSASIKTNA
jgi:hypothetical protein